MKHIFPSDLVVENEGAAALRRTLAYLDRHGWRQGTATCPDGTVCVGMALQMVGGGLCSPAAQALRQVVGRNIEVWNDAKMTSFSTVGVAIRNAIEIASGMPA